MPSNIGGAHWGGVAVDPVRQVAVIPVNRLAAMVQLMPREGFDLEQARAKEQRMGDDYEYNIMHGTPYVMRRRILLAPSRLPCTPPPFGTLVAIDLETGAESGTCRSDPCPDSVPAELAAKMQRTGDLRISAGRSSPPAAWCSSAPRSIDRFTRSTSRAAASCGKGRCRRAARPRR